MSTRTGRPSIFPDKVRRYQGSVTDVGSGAFEAARRRLAGLVGWPVSRVSDGDVFEFLARGEAAVKKELKTRK